MGTSIEPDNTGAQLSNEQFKISTIEHKPTSFGGFRDEKRIGLFDGRRKADVSRTNVDGHRHI